MDINILEKKIDALLAAQSAVNAGQNWMNRYYVKDDNSIYETQSIRELNNHLDKSILILNSLLTKMQSFLPKTSLLEE